MQQIKTLVRSIVRHIAIWLNKFSGSKITPNSITLVGLLAHVPIALLIADGKLVLAGSLLIVFGLFDTLDGELARLQKSTSASGMFLDSSTDRVKELFIYLGLAAWITQFSDNQFIAVILVGALGASIITSYLNAWGEAVLSHHKKTNHINKTFRGGLAGLEVRTFIIILSLIANQIQVGLVILLVVSSITVIQRFTNILRRLNRV